MQDYRHPHGGRSYGREGGRFGREDDDNRFRHGRGGEDVRSAERGERYQTGTDRDRYQTGGERRYQSDWDEESSERGYSGDRSYSAGGYPEEFGYRRERERDLGRDYGRSRSGSQFGSEQYRGFEDDTPMQRWRERERAVDESGGDYYFGTGSHYGGGYGSVPGTRASGQGSFGTPGPGREGSERGAPSRYGQQGSFRGRGPKGYTRSDDRLKEMICERLTDDPDIDASDIGVEVVAQVVTLSGTVDDRRTKYEIEELVERLGGVKDINNQVRVQSERSQLGSTSYGRGPASGSTAASGPSSTSSGTVSPGTPTPTPGTSSTKRN